MQLPIVDNPMLRIAITPGDTDVAVVSFSGIEQELGSVPREEFVNTLAGSTHSHFFVVDKQCSWYNATSSAILNALGPHLRNFHKVVTIGNSMGGFGAIYFASRLPNCRTAIAFVPQFSVDPNIVPGETRWKQHRSRFKAWPVRHAMYEASGDVSFHIFFGGSDKRDQAHLALFKSHATAEMSIFSLPGAAHGVAKYLRQRNLLRPVLNAAILKDTGAMDQKPFCPKQHTVQRLVSAEGVTVTFWSLGTGQVGGFLNVRYGWEAVIRDWRSQCLESEIAARWPGSIQKDSKYR